MIKSGQILAAAFLLCTSGAYAQSAFGMSPAVRSTEVTGGSRFFSLEHKSQSSISAPDSDIVQQQGSAIADAARFFLFNVAEGTWTYEQVMCPEMPDQILLQYSNVQDDGRESRFSALVPKQAGRVRIIPVVYRGGAGFGSPVSNPRNIRIFNAAVPANIARQSIDENGHWLSLAACYVELTAGHSHIATEPAMSLDLVRAPDPTMVVQPGVRQVLFTDRAEQSKFIVWSVDFSKDGRVTSAGMERRDFAKSRMAPLEQVPVTRDAHVRQVPTETTLPAKPVPGEEPLNSKPVPVAETSAPTPAVRIQAATPADATTATGPIAPVTAMSGTSAQDRSLAWRDGMALVPSDRKVKVVEHPSYPKPIVRTKPSYPQGRMVTPADAAPN